MVRGFEPGFPVSTDGDWAIRAGHCREQNGGSKIYDSHRQGQREGVVAGDRDPAGCLGQRASHSYRRSEASDRAGTLPKSGTFRGPAPKRVPPRHTLLRRPPARTQRPPRCPRARLIPNRLRKWARNEADMRGSLANENRSSTIRCASVVYDCARFRYPFTLRPSENIWNDDSQTQFEVGASGRTATLGLWPDGL